MKDGVDRGKKRENKRGMENERAKEGGRERKTEGWRMEEGSKGERERWKIERRRG